jgi:hypothetical protein
MFPKKRLQKIFQYLLKCYSFKLNSLLFSIIVKRNSAFLTTHF